AALAQPRQGVQRPARPGRELEQRRIDVPPGGRDRYDCGRSRRDDGRARPAHRYVSAFALDDALIAELGWQQPRSAIQQIANPAVGGGFTEAMPGTFDTEVLACSFRLVTDANAGSRNVVFQYLDQDGVSMFSVAAPDTQ